MDELKTVLWIEEYSPDLGLPPGVWSDFVDGKIEIWNAARPLPGHETYRARFVRGIFFSIIRPEEEYAEQYRKRCRELDAKSFEFVTMEQVWEQLRVMVNEYAANGHIIDLDNFEQADLVRSYIGYRKRVG